MEVSQIMRMLFESLKPCLHEDSDFMKDKPINPLYLLKLVEDDFSIIIINNLNYFLNYRGLYSIFRLVKYFKPKELNVFNISENMYCLKHCNKDRILKNLYVLREYVTSKKKQVSALFYL